MKSRHGSLFWRTASSLVAAPLFLLLLFLGGWPLRVLAAGLALLGLREYFALRLEKRDPAFEFTAYVLLLFFFLPEKSLEWLGFLAVLSLLALSTAGLFRGGALLAPTVAVAFFGLWYIGGGFFYLPELRSAGNGMGHLLVAVLTTWAVDVAAFFVGTILGRHKLAPTLSPGKTVEGALGGLAAGLVVAAVGGHFFGMLPVASLGMGLAVGVAAQLGDLVESSLKRAAGAKESGSFLPGHGGLLDRFDSLLFVLPVVYWYWRL